MNFDYVGERARLDSFRASLYQYKDSLKEGKRMNQERETIILKLSKARASKQKLDVIVKASKMLEELVIAEDINFKNRRLEYISQAITDNLAEIFPYDGFVAKVTCDFKRGMKTKLELKDELGRESAVHISEGKLLQSQISYGAALAIVKSLGANKLYLDEAFAVSSPENLSKVAEITQRALNEGIQIFMIEQYSNGYKDLKRREFHLTKNPVTKAVDKPVVLDY